MTTICDNRQARFQFFIKDEVEAGIMLTGTEVRAIREGSISIAESYIDVRSDGFYLVNAHIGKCKHAGVFYQHEERRPRKLLLRRREMNRMRAEREREGMTIVPIRLFNKDERGLLKLVIGVAKGKKLHDKRESIKQKEWDRNKARVLKGGQYE